MTGLFYPNPPHPEKPFSLTPEPQNEIIASLFSKQDLTMVVYHIHYRPSPPPLESEWDDPVWNTAETVTLEWHHPDASPHRPRTSVRLLHSPEGLHLFFRVDDRYVVARHTRLNDPVCKDSCVEFFVEPPGNRGYFNFEFNCGGVLHLSHITDPTRDNGRFRGIQLATPELARMVQIRSPWKAPVVPPIEQPVVWTLQAAIPYRLFETVIGPVRPVGQTPWRGNFYKCGSDWPHYLAWSPIRGDLDFHQPRFFGRLEFIPNGETPPPLKPATPKA
jgi:hypothetical protein